MDNVEMLSGIIIGITTGIFTGVYSSLITFRLSQFDECKNRAIECLMAFRWQIDEKTRRKRGEHPDMPYKDMAQELFRCALRMRSLGHLEASRILGEMNMRVFVKGSEYVLDTESLENIIKFCNEQCSNAEQLKFSWRSVLLRPKKWTAPTTRSSDIKI